MHRLKVFLTVDSEIWPAEIANDRLSAIDIRREFPDQFEHYILGKTAQGEFGIRHQMRVLDRYGLKATFFQESLFSDIVGRQWLADIVSMIGERGHDVQLHAHTEWLGRPEMSLALPRRINIREYSLQDQVRILARAAELLTEAGSPKPNAFRAGNFGASRETLTALGQIGIAIDSSYNYPYLRKACALSFDRPLTAPVCVGPVMEVPIGFFRDYVNHARPAHLIACSLRELEWALSAAWRAAWTTFVIVWHSRELLHPRPRAEDGTHANPRLVARFEGLVRFLGTNEDRFECNVFRNCDPQHIVDQRPWPRPIRGRPILAAQRVVESAISRLSVHRA